MLRPVSGIIPLLMIVAGSFASASELAAPQKIKVAGRPIDVEHVGHAAPFVGDFDGDGRKDLLVGEYYKGRLRIYRNGTAPSISHNTLTSSVGIWASS